MAAAGQIPRRPAPGQRLVHKGVAIDLGRQRADLDRAGTNHFSERDEQAVLAARGTRVLVSNANPKLGRRELHISSSSDGRVFTRVARLDIPSTQLALGRRRQCLCGAAVGQKSEKKIWSSPVNSKMTGSSGPWSGFFRRPHRSISGPVGHCRGDLCGLGDLAAEVPRKKGNRKGEKSQARQESRKTFLHLDFQVPENATRNR